MLLQKPDIGDKNQDIGSVLSKHIQKQVDELKKVFDGNKTVFGRSDIVNALKLAPSSASELIKKLLASNMIEPVKGHGKGKYRFADI